MQVLGLSRVDKLGNVIVAHLMTIGVSMHLASLMILVPWANATTAPNDGDVTIDVGRLEGSITRWKDHGSGKGY